MKTKKRFIFILILLLFLNFSCSTQQEKLIGFWENNEKLIEFAEEYFIIYNKTSTEVIAFAGNYTFAQEPSNAIKMFYTYMMDSSGEWISLNGTDLENYSDTILFVINNNTLDTRVIENGQFYSYLRISNPYKTK